MKLNVKFDRQRLLASVDHLKAGLQDTATVRALNVAARSVRTDVSRRIAAQYRSGKFSSRAVLKRLRLLRATRNQLVAGVEALGGMTLPLSLFAGAQGRLGVPVRVFGAQGFVRHAFYPTAGIFAKRGGVFIRAPSFKSQLFPGAVQHRRRRVQPGGLDLPIAELRVAGVPKIFMEGAILAAMGRTGRAAFNRELERQLRLLSARRG